MILEQSTVRRLSKSSLFNIQCNECKYDRGRQNNGGCSRENGVEQGQNAGISQQETLADDEPEDNEFLDFSFGM